MVSRPKRWVALLAGICLTGCSLLGGKPTELPWRPTETASATVAPLLAPTATPVSPTSAATQPLPTPTIGAATATQTRSPQPTASMATPTSSPLGTAAPAEQFITLEIPVAGQQVENPLVVRGSARFYPFEGTLVVRVFDARDQLAAEVAIIAQGDYGQTASFLASIPYGGVPGRGRVEVLEFSPRDGSPTAVAAQSITLSGFPGRGYIELPTPLTKATLPIGILARVGAPGQQVRASVVWEDGTRITSTHTLLHGLDGRGLLVAPLDAALVDHPATQPGAVEITTPEGSPLAWQPLTILHPDDAGTMPTKVYWVRDGEIVSQALRVPRTPGIGRASLDRLLWGPIPGNADGFTSAIPSAADVLAYPGRDSTWAERVTLRQLSIVNGVAYADFSLELNAHAGGAEQSVHIREQIEATLRQFATVDSVVITVNGQPALLEP